MGGWAAGTGDVLAVLDYLATVCDSGCGMVADSCDDVV